MKNAYVVRQLDRGVATAVRQYLQRLYRHTAFYIQPTVDPGVIRIEWVDGPLEDDLQSCIQFFKGSKFLHKGKIGYDRTYTLDHTTYETSNIIQFECRRSYSPERKRLLRKCVEEFIGPCTSELQYVHMEHDLFHIHVLDACGLQRSDIETAWFTERQ
ncbi:hypothetical protein [Paenibacillus bovis]|uniref:hypothetical protein n=1 Tax=Paenibacillus bovis TaxID=1616788 RepID=UPI000B353304|nr:hypothetical protein [Paenibacillus bovis]